MYPELGFAERRTAAVSAAKLLTLGIEAEAGVAGTGVVGRRAGPAGPAGRLSCGWIMNSNTA